MIALTPGVRCPPFSAVTQHPVDDRHDVGQRLAGAGPGGQHVRLAGRRGLDGLALVAVQRQRAAARVILVGLDPEDALALRVEQTIGHELGNAAAGFEARIQAEPGVGPLTTLGQFLVDVVGGDADRAPRRHRT